MSSKNINHKQWLIGIARYTKSQPSDFIEISPSETISVKDYKGKIQNYPLSEFSKTPIKVVKREARAEKTGESRYEVIFAAHPLASGFEGDSFISNAVIKLDVNGMIYDAKLSNKLIKLVKNGKDFDVVALNDENAFFREMYDNKSHLTLFDNDGEYKAGLSMKLFPGETLKNMLTKSDLTVKECLVIACNLAKAVREMHNKGIVHHDLNMSNVMVDFQLNVKIIDFGLSKKAGAPAGNLAKLWTMAPERALNSKVESDSRQDFFSYAGILTIIFKGLNALKRAQENSGKTTFSAVSNNAYDLHGLFKSIEKTDKLEILIRAAIHHLGNVNPELRSESLDDFIEQIEQFIEYDLIEAENDSIQTLTIEDFKFDDYSLYKTPMENFDSDSDSSIDCSSESEYRETDAVIQNNPFGRVNALGYRISTYDSNASDNEETAYRFAK